MFIEESNEVIQRISNFIIATNLGGHSAEHGFSLSGGFGQPGGSTQVNQTRP
jgi:hypothetical protein